MKLQSTPQYLDPILLTKSLILATLLSGCAGENGCSSSDPEITFEFCEAMEAGDDDDSAEVESLCTAPRNDICNLLNVTLIGNYGTWADGATRWEEFGPIYGSIYENGDCKVVFRGYNGDSSDADGTGASAILRFGEHEAQYGVPEGYELLTEFGAPAPDVVEINAPEEEDAGDDDDSASAEPTSKIIRLFVGKEG